MHNDQPPNKRMRGGDWEDRHDRGGGFNDRYERGYDGPPAGRNFGGGRGGGAGAGGAGGGAARGGQAAEDADGVQPLMMSFKSYLGTQDDSISDEDAVKKYAEYKLEFKRQQLNEFFVSHKDEEWFKLKYHPEDSTKRKEECKAALEKRIDVFIKFMDEDKLNTISIDGDQSDTLVKLLDSVVIYLEGGSELDLQILEQEALDKAEEKKADEAAKLEKDTKKDASDAAPKEASKTEDAMETDAKKEGDEKKEDGEESSKRKRKRNRSDDDDSEGDCSDSEEEPPAPGAPTPEKEKEKEETNGNGVKESNGVDAKKEDIEESKDEEEKKEKENENDTEKGADDEKEKETEKEEDVKMDDGKPKPRALYQTTSIFLRNLAPTITKQEVEAMCKRYPGFLRAAIADPQPERRWFRRGWITFERDLKIKEICYSLNNIRLRDFELGPIVNRDLSRRIRTVNGITIDKKVVRNDIKLAAKIITNLDKRWGLWVKEAKEEPSKEDSFGLESANPLLSNITDYLIEEASAEEEELLGKGKEDGEAGEIGESISRDDDLIAVLDKLIFYLRIVHSVDFYNHSEYPNEDEMPNRCGIMHARGMPPTGKINSTEMEDYCATFEKKMGGFLIPRQDLSDDEAAKIGMKNEEDEVEKFMAANTQELGKDKWH